MKKAEDRRVRRTRAALQAALMALMTEKGYESTTVQDIIDRANVGRATFYSHFADKKTLLVSRIEDLRSALVERQRQPTRRPNGQPAHFAFSLAMLEHAAANAQVWKAISESEGGAFVLRRIHDMLADLVRSELGWLGLTRGSFHREMLVQHITGAFMGTMLSWIDDGAKLPPAELDEIFRRLVMPGLSAELWSLAKGAR